MVKDLGDTKRRTETAPYSTDWIGQKAAAYIDTFARAAKPWFMQVVPMVKR